MLSEQKMKKWKNPCLCERTVLSCQWFEEPMGIRGNMDTRGILR
ncbi:hypothetical protein HMPREF1985_01569 [Mitsuokella sp. oral taxon 131 str. W9106]|nr:hypothetical protein HMPREF1985_01569 [Mitsuokella sp. oral taxon 131 str. W9106]